MFDQYREDQLNKVSRKIYGLLEKAEVSAQEFSNIFRMVRKEVLRNAHVKCSAEEIVKKLK